MKILDEKPVPSYEHTCCHCGSLFAYELAETKRHIEGTIFRLVQWRSISCPVCRVSNEVKPDGR